MGPLVHATGIYQPTYPVVDIPVTWDMSAANMNPAHAQAADIQGIMCGEQQQPLGEPGLGIPVAAPFW